MMKLIMSLSLIWTLSSTAEALQCWHGNGTDTKQRNLITCNSNELCANIAYQETISGQFSQNHSRMCLPSSVFGEGFHEFSNNLGFEVRRATVQVCNSDRCNNLNLYYPTIPVESNLTCFTCDDPYSDVCNKAVTCMSGQDRCINATRVDTKGNIFRSYGCVSKNLCEVDAFSKFTSSPPDSKLLKGPKCCESSFCNSAWSVKLNVIPLLFGLITLIVY